MTEKNQLTDSFQPHVRLEGVSKTFGGITVLENIDLDVVRGSVHALVGENGAGKSTLSKIIAGIYQADAGVLTVAGNAESFRRPREALARGIATIAQETALVPGLTIEQNVFLGSEPTRGGFVQRRKLRKQFLALAAESGFDLAPTTLVSSLRLADQQKVEILRALASGADFIIMDEPSAALSGADIETLHALIRMLSASGRTILLISHFLSEVLSLATHVTILRDGKLIRSSQTNAETHESLISGMLGRELTSIFPPIPPEPPVEARAVLEVSQVSAAGVNVVSFSVRPGEIVGLAGLVGAGRSEIVQACLGANPRTTGEILVEGHSVRKNSVRAALDAGIFLIAESRKEQGLVLQRSIRENVSLSNLGLMSSLGWVRRSRERPRVASILNQVTVRGDDTRPISALSGGNQQKALFGRALLQKRKVLLADEPTRGVDIGSRRAIYDLIVDQAASGVGVVIVSSDMEEVLGLAHRVLVVKAGRIVAELTGNQRTEKNILAAAFDESESQTPFTPHREHSRP